MNRITSSAGLDDLVTYGRLAIDSSIESPSILAALANYGFDEARLQAGNELIDTVVTKDVAQKRAYGKQYAASLRLAQAWQEADATYYDVHRRLAKLMLKQDTERLHALLLSQRKKRTYAGWVAQATWFYTSALEDPNVVDAFAQFNISQVHLEEGLARVEYIHVLKKAQEKEKTAAQKATKARDTALGALNEYLSTFREVARIALTNSEDDLETLQLAAVPQQDSPENEEQPVS